MRAMWERLQPREKRLLQAAGGLLLIALVIQGGLVPMQKAGEAAKERLVVAQGTIARLQRLQVAGVSQVPQPGDSAGDPVEIAVELGLVLADQTAAMQGDLQFRFDGAEPTVVFAWMDRVETGAGLRLVAVQMVSAGQGRVDATVEYAGARQP